MARIIKTAFAPEFTQLFRSQANYNENRDCSVKAIALVCGVSYDVAHAALAAQGRKNKKGCYRPQQRRAIEALGFKVRVWARQEYRAMITTYPGIHKTLKHITTHHMRRFPQSWVGCHPNMLLFTSGHVAALLDGKVIDWSINKSLRVDEIWEVEKV